MTQRTYSKQELLTHAWRNGNLRYKCHEVQKQMYDLFYNSEKHSMSVWLLSRQSGKSYLLAILALEQANKKSNAIIKIITDTKSHIRSIFDPIFVELLQDCPQDLKPEFSIKDLIYYFPNGSQVQLAGTDNKHYEKLRGQKSELVLIDEAGFCNDLDYVVKSVLIPTTTHTGGKIVLASTPPAEADHEFLKFIEEAETKGTLTKKTIHDNPLLTKEQVALIIDKMGGAESDRFKREYLCELIRDHNTTVIPEFTPELESLIVKEWIIPPFFDAYVAMDIGFKDLTVLLFGFYDFKHDKVIIEDELTINFQDTNNNLQTLSEKILQKEEALWTNKLSGEVKKPHLRVSDINYLVTQEIGKYSNYQLNFLNANKFDNDAAINQVRLMISNQKIIINPKCVTLIRHLKNARWQSNKKIFARSPVDGHYDAIDALKYLIKSITYSKNPYPSHYNLNNKDLFISNPERFNAKKSIDLYRKIFNIREKRR